MLYHARSFEESETSGSLMAQGQASMMGVATHSIQTPIIFDG